MHKKTFEKLKTLIDLVGTSPPSSFQSSCDRHNLLMAISEYGSECYQSGRYAAMEDLQEAEADNLIEAVHIAQEEKRLLMKQAMIEFVESL